jgi:nitrogen PTS system EIIA component
MMRPQDLIAPSSVLIDVRAGDKQELLRLLARAAAPAAGLDADRLADALAAREALGSTGVGGGVALPHARLAEVRRPIGFLARLRRPLAFDAVDARPVDLVCLALLPSDRENGAHLVALACLSRRLRDPEVVSALRDATTAADLYEGLTGSPAP